MGCVCCAGRRPPQKPEMSPSSHPGRIPSRNNKIALKAMAAAVASQRLRYTDPTLVQCWTSVCDAGPTLNQHWVTASCLLGYRQGGIAAWRVPPRLIHISQQIHSPNVDLMLGRCRGRWPKANLMLGQRLVLDAISLENYPPITDICAEKYPASGPTLAQWICYFQLIIKNKKVICYNYTYRRRHCSWDRRDFIDEVYWIMRCLMSPGNKT